MGASPAIVAAEQAAYHYGGSRNMVGPFDLTVRSGEFHLISGRSGCGKSTLARMLSGLIPHLYRGRFTGHVRVDGRLSDRVPLWELSARVGVVAQNPAAQVLASTVADEIGFGLDTAGLTTGDRERRLQAALGGFGLEHCARRDPRTLSGGEQQMVLLAALSAREPRALVLDEPLSMLDHAVSAHVVEALARLRRDGTAVVVFEHRTRPFARVEGLKRLRLVEDTAPERPMPELRERVPAFRLRATGVGVELGGRGVLRDIDLDLAGGQAVAVVGANGSGKTTLLRALAGLQAHRGQVCAVGGGGRPLLGMCFQNADRQIFNATVRQEIVFGLRTHDEEFYRAVVDLLGLAPYEQTPPLLLSEGEKKRLALAIALLRPGLCGVCLDEPTLGQDAGQRRILGQIIRRLAAAGYLCLIATHDLEWAAQWSDRTLALQDGRLVATPSPDDPGVFRSHVPLRPCRTAV
ncbi:MAG: ABC transporter ATP-binding protein [Candidatus Binatia bacterium]